MADARYPQTCRRGGARTGWSPLAGVLCLALAGPACSPKTYAIKMVADTLSEGTSSFATDDDPELIKEALPFGLKRSLSMAPAPPSATTSFRTSSPRSRRRSPR